MLNSYRTLDGYISANEENAVYHLQLARTVGRSLAPVRVDAYHKDTKPKSYRTRNIEKPQGAKGRIRAALIRAFPHFEHGTIGALAKHVIKCACHVHLDRDNPNTHLAFSPAGIGPKNYKARRSLTFAKFIRRKCSATFVNRLAVTDSQVENMQAGFQLAPAYPLALRIVTGQDAFRVYDDSDHGICSCMSGHTHKSQYVKHHLEANPETISLVTARDGKQLAIRAKLFHNDDDSYFLDRVYWYRSGILASVVSESELREWIKAHLVTLGHNVVDYCDVTLNHTLGEFMPYLDRCRHFDRVDDDSIRLHCRGEFCAENTDGTDASAESGVLCCSCNCRVDEDDARNVDCDTYCDDCYSSNFTWDELNECDIDNDSAVQAIRILHNGRRSEVWTHRDNCVELHNGEWCVDEHAEELHDGQYALTDDAIELHDGQYALTDDAIELHDGQYALTDDAIELHDGQYALTDDAIELHDGQYALTDDAIDIVDDYGNLVYLLPMYALTDDAIDIVDDYGNLVYLLPMCA